jgi:lauroyl/myristoyl acyltransferase
MMYWIYRLLCSCANSFPAAVNHRLAGILGMGTYLFNRASRKNVRSNLEKILPAGTATREIRNRTRQVFVNFYLYLFEYFSYRDSDHEKVKQSITAEGRENFDSPARKNLPFITVSAHLGNWETGAVFMDSNYQRVNLIIQPHDNLKLNQLFISCRKCCNTKLITLGMDIRNAFKALKNGEILVMVGDWGIGDDSGLEVLFFGRKTRFPTGPAILAVKTGAPLIPGFTLRGKAGNFVIHIEQPISYNRQSPEAEQVAEITQKFASCLEKYVRQYPEQWMIFKSIWE